MPSDELKSFAGLAAITLLTISLLVYLGLKLNKVVGRRDSLFSYGITMSGTILGALITAFWVYFLVARGATSPQHGFAAFLRTADGLALALAGSVVFGGVAGAVLERLGYPIIKKKKD